MNTVSLPVKIFVLAIPFSHPFLVVAEPLPRQLRA